MQKKPIANSHISSLTPYTPGESKYPNIETPIKLSANENPLGCSPRARAAFARSASTLHLYPEGGAGALVHALSSVYGLEKNQITCGAGSDELITLIAAAYSGHGDEVLISQYGFLSHYLAALKSGAKPVFVKEQEYQIDLKAVFEAITEKTRLIYIANPNNPTGSFLPLSEIKAFHQKLDPGIILVLDSAYAEYIEGYDGGARLVSQSSNLIMLRTFSKIYGLAALRLGWAYADSEIIRVLNKIRLPFNVNLPAQHAGIAALEDQDFVQQSSTFNQFWRDWIYQNLRQAGYDLVQGYGNFLLIHFPKEEGKTASDAYQYLARKGIILRPVNAYGLSNSLRLSVGREADNKKVVKELEAFLKIPTVKEKKPKSGEKK